MSPPYRHYRDPDERAADQTAGCLIALVFLAIFLPLRAAWNASNKVHLYEPLSPDTPLPTARSKSRRDYTATDWLLIIIVCGIINPIGMLQLVSPTGDKLLGVILMGGVIVGAVCWQFELLGPATRISQAQTPLSATRPQTYTVYPQRLKADLVGGEKLVEGLLSAMPRLTFQLVADGTGTRWQVVDSEGQYESQIVMDTLKSYCGADTPVVVEAQTATSPAALRPVYRTHLYFSLANEYVAPLPFLSLLKAYDPLTTITQRLDTLQPDLGERIRYQVMVRIHSPTAQQKGIGRYQQGSVVALTGIPRQIEQGDTGLSDTLIGMKLSSPLYHCFLVVTLESQEANRLKHLAQIAADIGLYELVGHNHLQLAAQSSVARIETVAEDAAYRAEAFVYGSTELSARWREVLLVLSPGEVAALWHLPNETFTSQRIVWAGAPVPSEVTQPQAEAVAVGTTNSPGTRKRVFLHLADRAHHHLVTGKTGMGKSTLLHTLIHQDIAAGRGVVVIDPHGKLIDDVLRHSLPDKRLNDVVIFDCGDTRFPVPLNPFRISSGVSYEAAFNYVYWALRTIYASVWRERMDMAFRNVIHALLCDPAATPLDIERLFTDTNYRAGLLKRLERHPHCPTMVAQYWRSFGKKSASEQLEIASPIRTAAAPFEWTPEALVSTLDNP